MYLIGQWSDRGKCGSSSDTRWPDATPEPYEPRKADWKIRKPRSTTVR